MSATLHRRPAPQTPRPSPPRPPEPVRATGVPFPSLKPDGCRWALGGPPFRFCNAKNDGTSHYCAAHHKAALARITGWATAIEAAWQAAAGGKRQP